MTTDVERRLEDLYMHDSRSRRVIGVRVPARRENSLRRLTLASAALLAIALVVGLAAIRVGFQETTPLASRSTVGPTALLGEVVVRCGQTTEFVAPTANTAGSFVISADRRADLVRVPPGSGLAAAGGYNCVRIRTGAPSGELIEFLPMNSPEFVPDPSRSPPPTPRTP